MVGEFREQREEAWNADKHTAGKQAGWREIYLGNGQEHAFKLATTGQSEE